MVASVKLFKVSVVSMLLQSVLMKTDVSVHSTKLSEVTVLWLQIDFCS